MNTYSTQFSRRCPVNGDWIYYEIGIESANPIMAEAIEAAINGLPEVGLHEDFADSLHAQIGGRQTIAAQHRAIFIETTRGQP